MIRFLLVFNILLFVFSLNMDSAYSKIKLGIDVLTEKNFNVIKNKNVALLTNYAGRNSKGKLTLDILLDSKKCKLKKIFTPEHGFYLKVPAGKPVSNDTIKNIPVISLYGSNRKPTIEQMKELDAVIVDLQDVGVRSYTYISTMFKVMEAAAENEVEVIVLDRPNPLGGLIVDGNIVEKERISFVSIAPIPYIHGMTIGELANFFNKEGLFSKDSDDKPHKCSLTVIKMDKWKRWMLWEDTKLKWYPTSPNIPDVNSIRGMATLGVLGELGKFGIGIGSDYPFQFLTFPNFYDEAFNDRFTTLNFPGVELSPVWFSELTKKQKKYNPRGYKLTFNLNNHFAPYTLGIKFLLAIRHFNPDIFNDENFKKNTREMFCKVTGTNKIFKLLMNEGEDSQILNYANKGLSNFTSKRSKYLLYN